MSSAVPCVNKKLAGGVKGQGQPGDGPGGLGRRGQVQSMSELNEEGAYFRMGRWPRRALRVWASITTYGHLGHF